MNHRSVIKSLIVVVIGIVVAWSVVNISDYAHTFHASWIVWTMGAALGTANALSVYAYVMAKSAEVQRPAVIGIILFGGMSGTLQTLLYLQVGAPLLAALAFGWFGPVAEGVLAWLHAALSDEVVKQGKTSKAPVKNDKQASTTVKPNVNLTPTDTAQGVNRQLTPEVDALVNMGAAPLSKKLGVSRTTVYDWRNSGVLADKIMERLPELTTPHTNGFHQESVN